MNLYTAEVIEKRQLSPNILEIDLELIDPQEMDFKAGQCVGFHISENFSGFNNKLEKRLYSIASVPSQKKRLTFCIDTSPMGLGSSLVLALKRKDRLVLEGPYGGFTVPENIEKNLLFVATGVGIAPFRSMIIDLLERREIKTKITLLFGVRSEENIFYFDLFADLAKKYRNFIFVPALSQPKGEWNGYHGRLTKYLDENHIESSVTAGYICGGVEMIKDTRAVLSAKGFGPRDVKVEIFV